MPLSGQPAAPAPFAKQECESTKFSLSISSRSAWACPRETPSHGIHAASLRKTASSTSSASSVRITRSTPRASERRLSSSKCNLCSLRGFSGIPLSRCCLQQGKLRSPGRSGVSATSSSRLGASTTPLPFLPLASDPKLLATLSATLSKILGYLVILGSVFLKVPQILRILKSRSAEGLNRFSFEAECLGYTMALAYCVNRGVPFHIYGELFFIVAQSVFLMACIYRFSAPCSWTRLKVPLYIIVTAVLFSGHLPSLLLEAVYNMQTTVFTVSRLPQIWSNFQEGGTGELSAASYMLSVAGCVARLYTSVVSSAPASMIASSAAGLCTHGILLAQILSYGSNRGARVE